MKDCGLIVIGTSLGGLKALRVLLSNMKSTCLSPMVIVQHRDRDTVTESMLAEVLQRSSSLILQEAEDKTPIEPGNVYLAPADYHLLVDGPCLTLSTEVPWKHARPSIDVTFESAARSYGASLVGVVLTGSSRDGAEGAQEIERRGGLVLVQDPATAEDATMPRAALQLTKNATVLKLEEIGAFLCKIEVGGGKPNVFRANG